MKKQQAIKSKTKERFIFWFVLSFILNGYATGIPGISIGSTVLIVLTIITLFDCMKTKKISAEKSVVNFSFIITLSSLTGFCLLTIINGQLEIPLLNIIIGISKFWLWALIASICSVNKYDKKILLKWLCRFSIILTIYLIVQNIAFYLWGIYLPNIFKFGPLQPYAEEYANYERLSSGKILRAGSLLSESSFYGNFIICTLALYLDEYKNELRGKKLLFIIFLSTGVILSGSTSAILIVAIIILLSYRKINKNLKWQIGLIALTIVALATAVFPKLSSSNIGSSLSYSFEKFSYMDTSSRIGKSYGYLELIPKKYLILGTGIGTDVAIVGNYSKEKEIYLNSMTSLIIQSGCFGVLLFTLLCVKLYKKARDTNDLASKCLILAYAIKGLASGIYFSTYGILFMFIIVGRLIKEKDEYGKE